MKSSEIRSAFIEYFKKNGHEPIASSSLVPANDPTLMFTNAGMNQFKDCFLGADVRSYKRAVTCQKVMRIAGKHNDFENVGVTARHHTFFEMLGNFSFGDYFKADAIRYGWEFVTKVLGIPESRLWVTIFEKDDEAGELWKKNSSVKHDRIIRLGESENFWAMGETGPCGPCTEIHVFCGSDPALQTEEVLKRGDGNFLEIWNLVFMQFERAVGGKLTPLPKPSVDTGMGLERVTSIIQGARSNYDTDLLRGIITRCEELSGYRYVGDRFESSIHGTDEQYHRDVAMRVIADHSRAMAFIIGDGVMPSSDGRGYILRRIIRRAIRHGRVLKFKEPFLIHTTGEVVRSMSEVYPELKEQRDTIARVVDAEERKFHETLDSGLAILQKEVEKLGAGVPFPGMIAFLLHDTYGFPLDLTQDALKSFGRTVDIVEFEAAMNQQKVRSREDRKSQAISYSAVKIDAKETKFLGYDANESEEILAQAIPHEGASYSLVFEATPFYAESGGQVGDTGTVSVEGVTFRVLDTQKVQEKYFVHEAELIAGEFDQRLVGKRAKLSIDADRRARIRANHSSTHLLHYALRTVLGAHVKQAGSRVSEGELRFDFSHFAPVTDEQLAQIQSIMNEEVRGNFVVETKVLPVDEAIKSGAMALFGEKYGSAVRVVQIGPHSKELCGGTHVNRSGDIGVILVGHETGVAAGVRRIECVSGAGAHALLLAERAERQKLAALLKSTPDVLYEKAERLLERIRTLEKELERAQAKLASSTASDLTKTARTTPHGIKVICQIVETFDPTALRSLVDSLRISLGSGVVALGATQGDKAVIVAGVTSDLIPSIDAGKLIKEATKLSGGRGGGKADFAQAGGVNAAQLNDALERIFTMVG